MAATKFQTHQFTGVLAVFQVVFLILFAVWSDHLPSALPGGYPTTDSQIKYTDFQDVHVTLIVGFGFLVAFLRRYGFASFSISLLLAAFAIEWALILRGFLSDEFANDGKFTFSIQGLIKADFSAAVILISFGVLVGKLSPVQYLILAIIGTPASIVNECLVLNKLKIQDVGGSMVIHVFGAVFGLAVSKILANKAWAKSEHQGSVYHSEIFTFIGTAFLWVFWPSFNAVNCTADARYRAIVNSYVALVASTVTAFLFSQLVTKNNHFNIRHIVNASLAGGVALGATANILIAPFHAFLVGSFAGIISVAGFQFVNPLLAAKVGVHDTRAVFSLHALPGILGALASALFFVVYPKNTFPETSRIVAPGRDNFEQALFQLAGLGISIVIAAIAGVVTGFILKLSVVNQVRDAEFFCDADYFDVPDDYDFTTRVISHIDRVEVNEPSATKLTSVQTIAATAETSATGAVTPPPQTSEETPLTAAS